MQASTCILFSISKCMFGNRLILLRAPTANAKPTNALPATHDWHATGDGANLRVLGNIGPGNWVEVTNGGQCLGWHAKIACRHCFAARHLVCHVANAVHAREGDKMPATIDDGCRNRNSMLAGRRKRTLDDLLCIAQFERRCLHVKLPFDQKRCIRLFCVLLCVLRSYRVWMRALRPAPRVKGQPLTIPLGRLHSQTHAMFVFPYSYMWRSIQSHVLRSAFSVLRSALKY